MMSLPPLFPELSEPELPELHNTWDDERELGEPEEFAFLERLKNLALDLDEPIKSEEQEQGSAPPEFDDPEKELESYISQFGTELRGPLPLAARTLLEIALARHPPWDPPGEIDCLLLARAFYEAKDATIAGDIGKDLASQYMRSWTSDSDSTREQLRTMLLSKKFGEANLDALDNVVQTADAKDADLEAKVLLLQSPVADGRAKELAQELMDMPVSPVWKAAIFDLVSRRFGEHEDVDLANLARTAADAVPSLADRILDAIPNPEETSIWPHDVFLGFGLLLSDPAKFRRWFLANIEKAKDAEAGGLAGWALLACAFDELDGGEMEKTPDGVATGNNDVAPKPVQRNWTRGIPLVTEFV